MLILEPKPEKVQTWFFYHYILLAYLLEKLKFVKIKQDCLLKFGVFLFELYSCHNGIPQIINSLLEKHAPLKQITKKEIERKSKPWITTGILTSIQNKNKIYYKFYKVKDQEGKDLLTSSSKIIEVFFQI